MNEYKDAKEILGIWPNYLEVWYNHFFSPPDPLSE